MGAKLFHHYKMYAALNFNNIHHIKVSKITINKKKIVVQTISL